MPVSFTNDEFELMGKFLRTSDQEVAGLDTAITQATFNRDAVQVEHDLYSNMKLDALEKQDALLTAMATALDVSDPAYVHEVEYLAGHPSLGGTAPQNWQIFHLDELLVPVVDKTHADATPQILATEAQWNTFRDLQINELYGTADKLDALISNVAQLAAQRAAVIARNAYLGEIT